MGLPSEPDGIATSSELPLHSYLRINEMNKTTQSILLAAMLAASGFASAQNAAVPATGAETKTEKSNADRNLRAGEAAKPNASRATTGNTSGTTSAEVKTQKSNADRDLRAGEASKPNEARTVKADPSGTRSADVKTSKGNADRNLDAGQAARSGTPSASSAERKRMREERRAAAKAKREAKS